MLKALLPLLAMAAPLQADDGKVRTYASQIKDVDAVNSHWIEEPDGVALVDAQRLLPEAEQALRHLQATTGKPVTAIIITHAHTDHYGGLPVWLAAYPDARVVLDQPTYDSILNDSEGFIAARSERHGDRFATHAQLRAALSNAQIVEDGDRLTLGGKPFTFRIYGPSEAESHLIAVDEVDRRIFIGDLVNIGVPGVPFANLGTWLEQLNALENLARGKAIYQGHGPAPAPPSAIAEQRRFLQTVQSRTGEATGDGELSAQELEQIVFALEAEWPFYTGVAGNTRREMLAFTVQRAAEQQGARLP